MPRGGTFGEKKT